MRARPRESIEERTRQLVVARRRASAFLAAVTAIFIAVTIYGVHGTVLGFVQAGAEAAMVGGVADWFAVTALFRKPLGLPIPHTALIVERKDQFGATLGQFVQENFLNGEILGSRVREAKPATRIAAWLSDDANTARLAGHASALAVRAAGTLNDEDVQRFLTGELARAVNSADVAPLAGKALRAIMAEGHHDELFNAILAGADRYLELHYDDLRDRFEAEAPRWLPEMVYERLYDRLHTRLRERLASMAEDPDDESRRHFTEWLNALPDRLEHEPALRERAESLKKDVVGSTALRDLSSSVWQTLKEALRAQAADPNSGLHRRLSGAIMAAGHRLATDTDLQESIERSAESAARAMADQFHDELADLITGTIQRWDASETSNQLELLLGRDLQFIRINGTVVGAGIGVILHALALALA